jgi:hypothetical protein
MQELEFVAHHIDANYNFMASSKENVQLIHLELITQILPQADTN